MAALVTSTSTSATTTHADSKKEKCCLKCSLCGDASTNGMFMSCSDCAVYDKRALQQCLVCCLIYHNGHNIVEQSEGSILSTSLIAFIKSSQQNSSQQPSDTTGSALSESALDFYQKQLQGSGTLAMESTILSEVYFNNAINSDTADCLANVVDFCSLNNDHESYTDEGVVHETYTNVHERHEDTMIEVEQIPDITFGAKTCSEITTARGLPASNECAKKYCDCAMFALIVIGLQYFACFIILVLMTPNKL